MEQNLSLSPCVFASAFSALPSVLWHSWLGVRKIIRPVKIEWWGVGVVICLQRGADCLHMVQLIPCIPKRHHLLPQFNPDLILPGKKPLNGCCCCCLIILLWKIKNAYYFIVRCWELLLGYLSRVCMSGVHCWLCDIRLDLDVCSAFIWSQVL